MSFLITSCTNHKAWFWYINIIENSKGTPQASFKKNSPIFHTHGFGKPCQSSLEPKQRRKPSKKQKLQRRHSQIRRHKILRQASQHQRLSCRTHSLTPTD